MGHTNSTTNYNLPQFLTTDKPAWLTDINGAFSAIDTGIHNAQEDATTAGNNATQALSDASNAATAAATADGKGAGAVASIASAFDATSTYNAGQLVMYNSLLYMCTAAITTPGPWTGVTNWTRVTVDSIIGFINDLDTSDKTSIVNAINEVAGSIPTATSGTLSAATNVTLTRGFVAKQGRIATLSFAINLTANISSGTTVLTLPVGYHSSSFVEAPGVDGNNNATKFYINDGNIVAYANMVQGGNYYVNASFITA